MDPRIDTRIAMIVGVSHTISTPATKEVLADAARGSARVNQTLRHVRQTGRDGSTPCDTCMSISSKPDPSPVLIGSYNISPDCSISGSFQVGKKQQSNSPDKVRNAQKMDTAVDRKLPDDQYYASVFSKEIVRELYHVSSNYLYLFCRMNFLSSFFQTKAPHFVDLGILAINKSNELGVLGNTTTRIIMKTYVSHWLASDKFLERKQRLE